MLRFTPEDGWHHRPHTVKIFINGEDDAHLIGVLNNVIPRGVREFYVPPELLVGPGASSALNVVYLHTFHNGGHYVVTSRARLCVCSEEASVRRYLYASSEEEANECLRRMVGISPKLEELTVDLEPVDEAFVGEPITVTAHATSQGEPVPGLSCKLHDGCSGDILDLWFSNHTYRGTWIPRTEGSCRLMVTAAACGISAVDETTVVVRAHPCDGPVSALNRHFFFYEECCEHQGEGCTPRDNNETGADPGKFFAGLDENDVWIANLYPFRLHLFSGADLCCRFDGNTWYAGDVLDPAGLLYPEFAADMAGLLPDPALPASPAAPLHELVRTACGWLEGKLLDLPRRRTGHSPAKALVASFLAGSANRALLARLAFDIEAPGYRPPPKPAQSPGAEERVPQRPAAHRTAP
jgi:hypothetical protein